MISRWLFLSLALFSCENADESDLLQVNKENILYNNSSRIWVINTVTQKGIIHTKNKLNQKDVMVIFESGKVNIQPIATLGNYPEKFGKAIVSEDSKELFIDFKDEKWYFEIISISEQKIVLKWKKNSDFKYDLELIAYPEGR